MIKKAVLAFLAVFVVVLAVLAVVVSMQPAEFKISRSTQIAAPPERVFQQIDDFHKWDGWSPWAKLDPNMKVTHSGAPNGVGASYAWVGNSDVGEGRMTITQSHPSEHIAIDLDFISPFPAKNLTEFSLKPENGGTSVTWSMAGRKNFVMKAFGMIVDMDKAIGPDFERGLSQLKSVAETASN